MRRKKLSLGKSRKMFTRHASNPHPYNVMAAPMRGGIRL